MKSKEVRELTTKEIIERCQTDIANLDQLKLQHAISPLDNSNQIIFLRRDIARMKTVLRERANNQQN